MINRVALEGIDGSGKTTVAQVMVEQFAEEGIRAEVFAPYRAANEVLGDDIYKLWSTDEGAARAIDLLHQVMAEREAQALEEGTEVLIYDRQWMTAFTEIADRPELVERWTHFVPAAHLGVAPAAALRRLRNDTDASWSELEKQHDYAVKYGRLALGMREHMLGLYRSDEDVTPEALARNIIWDMNIRR
jgi:thymidylate kinase